MRKTDKIAHSEIEKVMQIEHVMHLLVLLAN